MKILIRKKGSLVSLYDLQPDQKHLLGRGTFCRIRLHDDHISRKHAEIYFENNQWWYKDIRGDHSSALPQPITSTAAIQIHADIELVTEEYVAMSQTASFEARELQLQPDSGQSHHIKTNKRIIWTVLSLFLIVCAGAVTYLSYLNLKKPMDSMALLKFARPKVVEFEINRDQKTIDQIIKYSGLTEKDFKDSIGFCTGFIVEKNIVLTARHCVISPHNLEIKDNFIIKTHDGKIHQPERILGFSMPLDYMFLEVPSLSEYEHFEFEPTYKIGEKVYTIGNVHGQGIAIRDGMTASKTEDDINPEIKFLRFSAAASPGNSGGPLLNSYGKVVGLVFARGGYSENYNLATDSHDLLSGMEQFHKNQDSKNIEIDFSKLPREYIPYIYSQYGLQIPYTWNTQPQETKELYSVNVKYKAPVKMGAFKEGFGLIIVKALTGAFDTVKKRLDTDTGKQNSYSDYNKTVIWEDHATPETPLIIPSPRYDLFNVTQHTDHFFVEKTFTYYLPSEDQWDYKYFAEQYKDHELYEYKSLEKVHHITVKADGTINTTKDNPFVFNFSSYNRDDDYYKEGNTTQNLKNKGYVHLDFEPYQAWENRRLPTMAERKEILLGDEGLRIDQIYHPFMRKNVATSFILKEIPDDFEETKETDSLGRAWDVFVLNLFKVYVIKQHCLQLPQGYLCLSDLSLDVKNNPLPYYADPKKPRIEELSQIMIKPLFWSTDSILDFYNSGLEKNLQGYNDVEIIKTENQELMIRLKTLDITYVFNKDEIPALLRITPALYKHQDVKKWIALGVSGYYPENNKENFKLCASEVQIQGMPPYLYATSSQKKNLSKKITSLIPFEIGSLGNKGLIAGYCQMVTKISNDTYKFGELAPHDFNYLIGYKGDLKDAQAALAQNQTQQQNPDIPVAQYFVSDRFQNAVRCSEKNICYNPSPVYGELVNVYWNKQDVSFHTRNRESLNKETNDACVPEFIDLAFVDTSDNPLPNQKMFILLKDNVLMEVITSQDGKVRIEGLPCYLKGHGVYTYDERHVPYELKDYPIMID
ncbi:MAG: trypsin-like peptidase domain-containing protein [Deltaproteobacteria bacterium]|nr:trypsin-like peptidase domain-containing protein [Deltaproteobacteria bacterium]